jgi:UPF0755 protein
MAELTGRRGTLLIAGGVAAVLAALFLLYAFLAPNEFPGSPQRQFFVSKGESYSTIVDSLESQGLIRSRFLFDLVARILGGRERIQVGKYPFTSGVSNGDLFLSLRSGRGNALIIVGIPEGLRARAQAHLFARALGIDTARFMELVHDESFARSLGVEGGSLEGYLFPDTYGFYWQQGEEEVIRRLVGQFWKFYSDSLLERQEAMGWTTQQVLTLASIVEGEAVRDQERPIIAGVYVNRLRRGMKLEADPTIQYILNGRPRRLRYGDLKVDNPYNTYLYTGLPPGPVDNPGRASILSALYPDRNNYLFFVADGKGGHWFASSYREHLRNVRKYRRYRALQE